MKHRIKNPGRAVPLAAALGLAAAAIASSSSHGGMGGPAFLYDSSYSSDTTSPFGGSSMGGPSGMGGSGVGADTAFGRDTSRVRPGDTSSGYPYPGTAPGKTFPGGGSGLDTLRSPDSLYPDTGGLNPYPGTGGSGDTGMGGTGNGGTGTGDSLNIRGDSTRTTDSLGVPDWDEQG
ncbi:MAG TPA: hypothetical protein VJ385_05420 [Fibrobacteria bacterium]|nr:hypothetical protein [Fibrobacteria bacterium]